MSEEDEIEIQRFPTPPVGFDPDIIRLLEQARLQLIELLCVPSWLWDNKPILSTDERDALKALLDTSSSSSNVGKEG